MKRKWLWGLIGSLGVSGMLTVFLVFAITAALLGAVVSSDSGYAKEPNQEGEVPTALLSIYFQAEAKYGVPWSLLAALSKVTTGFGQHPGEELDRIGWIPFSHEQWTLYGIDGDNDNRVDPNNPWDAIDTAAHFLSLDDPKNIETSLRRYRDADSFVQEVLHWTKVYQSLIPSSKEWIWPLPGFHDISSGFGRRTDPLTGKQDFHKGIDLPAPIGTPVLAVRDGTVVQVLAERDSGGYGNLIVIQHSGGVTSWYAHLSAAFVTPGTRVHRGEQIGAVGSTGRSTGSHLHLEIRVGGKPVDPLSMVRQPNRSRK
ncbi:M23 family metallopeptidase [Effusibacillus consociatus]|uniref:M23 family metallopeptidase n=1 Tax=Effusibacillus consociatus TaxID=1117041 RepID=A0ABV9Q3C1_9BACL